jgi:quercetin dioxygenase-like cupin family protein
MFDRTKESAAFQPADHPVSRGVGPFTLYDEFYPTIRFPPNERVVPILPGTFHVEMENGKPAPARTLQKTAAWAFERPNGGRSFAFSGLHYLQTLDHPQMRRLLLNAIAWTAAIDVPSHGVRSGVPDAATKLAASLGAKPLDISEPKAPQNIIATGILSRSGDRKPEPQPWGELKFFVNRTLKNSDTLTVLQAVIKPGQQNGRHYHPNCDEVLVLVQGHIMHTVNDQTFEMRAGDVLTIPRGAMHNARNLGKDNAILMVSYNSADRVAIGESE